MLDGAQKHGMEGSSKLGGVPDVTIIHEYGGAVRIHGQFQFGSVRAETQWATVRRHLKSQRLHAPGFHNDGLCEAVIARLPYGNFMLAWQEHDLFVALKLLQVAHILTVDPYAGILRNFRRARKFQLTHHLVLLCLREIRSTKQKSQAQSS